MRRLFLILLLALSFCIPALGAQALTFTTVPTMLRPGTEERFTFSSDEPCTADFSLENADGQSVCTLQSGVSVPSGSGYISWNGLLENGEAAEPGEYTLHALINGEDTAIPLSIGEESPTMTLLSAGTALREGSEWTASVYCDMDGTLLIEVEYGSIWELSASVPVLAGQNAIKCALQLEGAPLPAGSYALRLALRDNSGFRGASQQIDLTIGAAQTGKSVQALDDAADDLSEAGAAPVAEPSAETGAPSEDKLTARSHIVVPSAVKTKADETSYWTMTLGDLADEQAIWDIMMQPITVIDQSGRTAREAYRLRATPDKSTAKDNVVGEITYQSQGVHVLETLDNGWTLVEAYNSSYGSTYTKKRGYGKTAELIKGYVETSALKTVSPKTNYGLLIDKFTQTLYVFSEGKIIGSLLVSTGKVTASQPWNETPAGEFLVISRSGGFYSGNLFCDMGLLLNGGCLIHEVPCIINEETGLRNYGYTEPQLGQKASHGCIRVQRAQNDQGQNMTWIWNNIKVNTKVLIWEDSTRYQEYPDSQLALYYNPQGGQYYHADPNCSSVNKRYRPLTGFTYGELTDEAYLALKPCKTCGAPERPEVIKEANQKNGFDE